MAKTNYQTIEEYHAAFTGEVLDRMQSLRKLIQKIVPEAEEVISYQIPAFKIGKDFLIYYSAYAKHITISHPWSTDLLKKFEKELKEYVVSKSAIQLPHNQELPMEFLEKLLRFRKEEILQNRK